MKSIKSRADSFYGIHCDFHARPRQGIAIGETLKEEDIRLLCETLRPDFFQIDCKGHPGWTSYPTELGNATPGIVDDVVAMWRKVTKEYGIGLYMHYSGLYEIKYCNEHEEDRVLTSKGQLFHYARADSGYADNMIIPQISELVEKYDIDGVWMDGDCWSMWLDYHPETIAKFEKRMGIDLQGNPPKVLGDPYYDEYKEFHRELFREYLNYYVDALHKKFPKLQICSNWAFMDHMPEPVCANVDYLSGDVTPKNCINAARHCGRTAAMNDLPWDLMSWDFRMGVYDTPLICSKHITQILQEAAAVISIGGAYQDNVPQLADGSHNVKQLLQLAPLTSFLREREDFCFKGKFIPQVAMWFSAHDRYAEYVQPYSREGRERLYGTTALLCDSGLSTELLPDHKLGEAHKYPLFVVPELYTDPTAESVATLQEYVKNGSSLLIVGASTAMRLAPHFGYAAKRFDTPPTPNFFTDLNLDTGHDISAQKDTMPCYFSLDGEHYGVTRSACTVDAEKGTAYVNLYNDLLGEGLPCAEVFPYGKGKVGVIGMDLGTQYHSGTQYLHRHLIRNMALDLYNPLAWVDSAEGLVELTCMQKDGKFMLHLINMNGNHHDEKCMTEEFIPAVYNANISIAADKPIEKLILWPEGKELPFTLEDGRYRFTVDKLPIHNIVEVQYK